MVIVCFQLSMPNNNSWNGKWTGDSIFYARTRSLSNGAAATVLKEGSYSYNFGDGWTARVDVTRVTAAKRKTIDKNTKGFCGYDWMINSILNHGDIRVSSQADDVVKPRPAQLATL